MNNGSPAHYVDTEGASRRLPDYDRSGGTSRRRTTTAGPTATVTPPPPDKPGFSMDAGSILRPSLKRWYWLLFGGVVGAVAGAMLGVSMWTTGYTASANIVRYEAPVASDAYRPPNIRGETVVGMLTLPDIRRRAAEILKVPFSDVAEPKATPERQGDGVSLTMSGPDPRTAVEHLNTYIRAAIEFTQEQQRANAEEAEKNADILMKEIEADLVVARKAVPSGVLSSAIVAGAGGEQIRINGRKLEQIDAAEAKLAELRMKYHDIRGIL